MTHNYAFHWIVTRGDSPTTHAVILTDSVRLLKKTCNGNPDWHVSMFDICLEASWAHTALCMPESREMADLCTYCLDMLESREMADLCTYCLDMLESREMADLCTYCPGQARVTGNGRPVHILLGHAGVKRNGRPVHVLSWTCWSQGKWPTCAQTALDIPESREMAEHTDWLKKTNT